MRLHSMKMLAGMIEAVSAPRPAETQEKMVPPGGGRASEEDVVLDCWSITRLLLADDLKEALRAWMRAQD